MISIPLHHRAAGPLGARVLSRRAHPQSRRFPIPELFQDSEYLSTEGLWGSKQKEWINAHMRCVRRHSRPPPLRVSTVAHLLPETSKIWPKFGLHIPDVAIAACAVEINGNAYSVPWNCSLTRSLPHAKGAEAEIVRRESSPHPPSARAIHSRAPTPSRCTPYRPRRSRASCVACT
jgi:hypothetical protein